MDCTAISSSKGIQDDDVALAKLLQEQERALYILVRQSRPDQDEELTDEELARRLQEEEDQAAYEALAYAEREDGGVEPDGGAGPSPPAEDEGNGGDMPLTYEDMLALGDLAGKVSKGLKEDALSRLPVRRVNSLRQGQALMSLDRCCICQLEFEEEDEATPLPCRHCYHSDCARQWLQQSRACPVCGTELELSATV